jgi:WD40 repeat protein
LRGHTDTVNTSAVAPDGSFIVSGSADVEKSLKLWNPTTGQCLRTLRGHTLGVHACAVAPDASFVVSASGDGTIKLWDSSTGAKLRTLRGHTSRVLGCAVAPDGSFVVSASWDGALKVWDQNTGRELRTVLGHTGWDQACAVSPDGSLVASAGRDRALMVWGAHTGEQLASIPLLGDLTSVALHPIAPRAICADMGGNVYVFDLVGIEYGPLVVTAFERGGGPILRCPACFHEHAAESEWLGDVITCPTEGCDQRLRVNSFVVKAPMARKKRSGLRALLGRGPG